MTSRIHRAYGSSCERPGRAAWLWMLAPSSRLWPLRSVALFPWVALFLSVALACDGRERPPAGYQPQSSGGTGSGSGGSDGVGDAGSMAGQAGEASGSSGADAGTSTATGGSPSTGGSMSAGGDAGADGSGGSGGTSYVSPCEAVEPEDTSRAVCDPTSQWSDDSPAVSMVGDNLLATITQSELSMAWVTVDPFTPRFWVADRASTNDDFSNPMEVSALADEGNLEQIALSPDGLRLVLVVDGQFSEFERAGVGQQFEATDDDDFELLNAAADEQGLADPVFAFDDLSLFYTVTGAAPSTLHVSKRESTEQAWPLGSALSDCELAAEEGGIRQPTGISSDGLTLFYYDLPRDSVRAAWRASEDDPFTTFVDLPALFGAQPNESCDRLYGSREIDRRLQLYVVETD